MDPHRIAEIIVVARDGRRSRGSGYRVGAVAVLTAAHMVADAASVTIRFDGGTPGEWTGRPHGLWTDDQSDLAVLHVDADNNIDTVPLGRIGDRAAVLPVRAAGFPRFKIRRDDGSDGSGAPYRDLHQADGTAAVLSNRKEGTLEVTVTPPERDDDAAHSPWEGMSGAAVWVNGRIVAVVARHYPSDGLGRLSATRLDRCLDRLDASRRDELLRQLGVAATGSAGLTEVLPPTTSALTRTAYRLQVQDIAPDELIGRERELDDIVAFCAGDRPYEWWQAGPWAGKTALMSWFVLHPPAGIDVVSFFVTARLAGQSDSEAFVEAMHEQLASLIGESASGSSPPAAPGKATCCGCWMRRLTGRASAGKGS